MVLRVKIGCVSHNLCIVFPWPILGPQFWAFSEGLLKLLTGWSPGSCKELGSHKHHSISGTPVPRYIIFGPFRFAFSSAPLCSQRCLIKEQHYLRVAALPAMKKKELCFQCCVRNEPRARRLRRHSQHRLKTAFNGTIVKGHTVELWCFTASAFQRWAVILHCATFKQARCVQSGA